MSINRYAARVDANQAEIVSAMRAAGALVWPIGLPVDLLVGYAGNTALVEIKRIEGKKAPKPAAHTKLQSDFLASWNGGPVATVTDIDGALRLLATLRAFKDVNK